MEQQAEAMRWLSRRCHDLQLEVLRLTVVRERQSLTSCTPLYSTERSFTQLYSVLKLEKLLMLHPRPLTLPSASRVAT